MTSDRCGPHATACRRPQASASKKVQNLLASFDRPIKAQRPTWKAATTIRPGYRYDIIAAAEKLQVGASVLDVSFDPKTASQSMRSGLCEWKNLGRFLDGTSGAAITGAVIDESALDAEDKRLEH